jgi:hypothetical protein
MGSRQAYILRKLRESTLPNNPYMSPLFASDDILRQFPTTYLVVSYLILFYSYSLVKYFPCKSVAYVKFFSENYLNISGMSSRSFIG